MPDTFVSWFLVTELHVWMIMVRYMAEGKNGQLIRNNVVSALWDDSKARIDKLGVSNVTELPCFHTHKCAYYDSFRNIDY